MKTSTEATLIGQAGLLIWATTAALASLLISIPSFEILFIIFALSFIISVFYITVKKRWRNVVEHPIKMWVIGIFCICGSEIAYIVSFKNIPAAHVELINYLWPLMLILFSSLLPNGVKMHWKYVLGGFLGLFAIYIILIDDQNAMLRGHDISGYFTAFLAALLWTIYNLFSHRSDKIEPEIIGLYCGFGALFVCFMHFYYSIDPTIVMPNMVEACIMIFMGFTTHSIAYFFWDRGIKRGDFRLLSVLSYANPIISTGILIMLGMAKATMHLIIGTFLICLSCLIASGVFYKKSEVDSNGNGTVVDQ